MTLYDMAYSLGLIATAPAWLLSPNLRRKIFDALRQRQGEVPFAEAGSTTILTHAVSMGEINATTALVRELSKSSLSPRFLISTTSRTGSDRARQLYEANPRVQRIRYPFDFSRSVARMLDAQRPAVAVLMELEVWPNFMLECQKRHIPVILINGRLSKHSFRNYKLAGLFTRPMFRRLTLACVQDEVYAERFARVGVPRDRIRVTGTMKFDTAPPPESFDADVTNLAQSMGLRTGEEPIWVCGSTGPGEERIILGIFKELLAIYPALRLVLVPRHPERFEEIAELIQSTGFRALRRSRRLQDIKTPNDTTGRSPVILGDTMGELRKFYGLADVVFVGRSLIDLGPKQHGSDMIEPAALAKPVIVGPFTGNFAEVMNCFRRAGAIREVRDGVQLRSTVAEVLAAPQAASELGRNARQVVHENQGATARHVEVIQSFLLPRGT